MNNGMQKRIKALGIVTCGATVVLAALWAILVATARDEDLPGYFKNGVPGVYVFYGILAAVGVFFLVSLLLLRKTETPRLQDGLPSVFFLSAACGFLLIAYTAVIFIVRVFGDMKESGGRGLFVAAAVFALAAAGGFFFRMLPEGWVSQKTREAVTGALGLAATLFALLYSLACYFDMSLMMNSPFKWMDQLFFMVLAFFFLTETGLRLEKAKFGTYLVLAAAAFCLGVVNGVGGIAAFLASGGGSALRDSVLHDFLQLALGLYCAIRFLAGVLAYNRKSSVILSGVKDEAIRVAAREEAIRAEKSAEILAKHAKKEAEAEEGGIRQQTIDDIAPAEEESHGEEQQ